MFAPQQFFIFLLVAARIGGLLAIAPMFGASAPARFRVLLTLALAAVVTPVQVKGSIVPPGHALACLLGIGREALLGLALGLGVAVLFSAIRLAGTLISQLSGISLAETFDPQSGESVHLFAELLRLVAVAVFLTIGGHRLVIAGLLDTFEAIPAGGAWPIASVADALSLLVSESFSLGIRTAAPVAATLLVTTLAMGLIGRAIPQLNMLSLGLGPGVLAGLAALSLSLGSIAWAFQDQAPPFLETLLGALRE